MGSRGPLPQNVTPIRAEVGHRPAPARTRRARPAAPSRPDWLDEYGARVWDRLIAELEPLGVLNPAQREIIAAYCMAASVNRSAWRELTPNKRRGPDILQAGRHPEDDLVRSKAWGILRESAALLDRLSRSLLTSPASLLRADIPDWTLPDDADLD